MLQKVPVGRYNPYKRMGLPGFPRPVPKRPFSVVFPSATASCGEFAENTQGVDDSSPADQAADIDCAELSLATVGIDRLDMAAAHWGELLMLARSTIRCCARFAVALSLITTSMCGCAGMKTPESQLFGANSNFQSASVTYRIERQVPAHSAKSAGWTRFLSPGETAKPTDRRVTMLAARYPHPAGRAGYARLECVTATIPNAAASQSSNWLERVGKLADETMPGISMSDGIHEAMGLDLPIGELEGILQRLQQSAQGAEPRSNPRQVVQVSYEIDGQAHPERSQRVPELEQLIARVRNEGSVISHSSNVAETFVSRPPASKAAAPAANVLPAQYVEPVTVPVAGGAIQPVSHEQPLATSSPTMWRLPAVVPVQ
jgi:hypothetical protein